MKNTIRLCYLLLFLLSEILLFAQSNSDIKRTAHQNYQSGNFKGASDIYENLWGTTSFSKNELLEAAEAFRLNHKLNLSIDALQNFLKKSRNKQKYLLQLARTMQYQKQFYNAAIVYKDYLKELKKSNPTRIQIEQEIIRCLNGLKINKKENVAIVEPLGTTLNTVNDEFAPIPSINFQGKYYFSAVKPKVLDPNKNLFSPLQSDLFTIEDNNGNWSAIHSLGAPFDSPKNEMILDLIDKGNGIVFLRSSNESDAEIMFKSFSSNNVEEAIQLDLPLYVNKGDRDLCFFQDSIIIFSSNRPGGYGGYDLYLSIKRGGTWMAPKNLGVDVNGPFNEVSPFIAKDGQTLFFSSNDLESIGGYDVFKVKFKPESNNWSIKENLGIPINSAGNEIQFRLDRSGRSGVFSSDRWDMTIGGKDIFIAYFKDELEEQFYEESGTVLPIFYSEHSIPTKALEGTSPKRDTFQKVKEYTLDFISCGDDDFLSDTKKQNVITEVLKLLKLYPNSQLQIIAHSNTSSIAMINLFTSIKKSNEVANSFISKNINSNRIKSIGCGSEYLVCKSKGQTNSFANNLNNRIEFHFLFGNKEEANINYSLLKLNENLRLNPLYQFHQSRLGISYSILLGESTQMLSQDIPVTDEEKKFVELRNGKYYYFMGNFKDFHSALNYIKSQSLKKGTIIQAFYDGEYLDSTTIINYVNDNPDLILLMDYNKSIH